MKINNYDEVVNELVDIMVDADVDCNNYQTDIYMYVDEEGKASLYPFENVSGHGWLDDDHITVWIDKQHYDNYIFDYYSETTPAEFAEIVGASEDEIIALVKANKDEDDDEDITATDILDALEGSMYWDDILDDYRKDLAHLYGNEYREKAEEAIDEALERLDD